MPIVPNTFYQGELEHRRAKRFYPRVSKAKFTSGIAKQQRRERILFRLAERELPVKSKKGKAKTTGMVQRHTAAQLKDLPSITFEESEPLAFSDPKAHYHVATSTRYFLNVPQWLGRNANDPALEVFADLTFVYYLLMSFIHRIFFLASKIISSLEFLDMSMMAMKQSSLQRNEPRCSSQTIAFSATRYCE
jgi:hypothetical protein